MAKSLVQQQAAAPAETGKQTLNQLMSSVLDGEGMRKRFDELLGKRAPQFVSSLVTMVNGDKNLQQAFYDNPISVVQAALKAATYDMPIDPALGYAYIVPFRNKGKMTATFVPGWKGYHQMALRTAMYKTINVTDVREGELIRYNRLTEEVEIDFIEDDERREKLQIIGYVGYYRLTNGFEKTIYRTMAQIRQHEKQNRKGQEQGYGWQKWPDAMARKTVYRELIGKWGIMSIDYRSQQYADLASMAAADDAGGTDEISSEPIEPEYSVLDAVDDDTGEVES